MCRWLEKTSNLTCPVCRKHIREDDSRDDSRGDGRDGGSGSSSAQPPLQSGAAENGVSSYDFAEGVSAEFILHGNCNLVASYVSYDFGEVWGIIAPCIVMATCLHALWQCGSWLTEVKGYHDCRCVRCLICAGRAVPLGSTPLSVSLLRQQHHVSFCCSVTPPRESPPVNPSFILPPSIRFSLL